MVFGLLRHGKKRERLHGRIMIKSVDLQQCLQIRDKLLEPLHCQAVGLCLYRKTEIIRMLPLTS